MMDDFFAGRTPNRDKLIAYGFSEEGDELVFRRLMMDGQFLLTVSAGGDGVRAVLLDEMTDEPYVLHLVEGTAGEFVGRVREEYVRALSEIAERCFEKDVFFEPVTHALIARVREKYGDEPEYLWANFPDNAIWRRKDNAKWYGALLTVERKKLGMKGEGRTEILDVRAEPDEVALLTDGKTVFPGWHMNKKHWISLPLDGSVPLEEVLERLEESYFLAGRK